MTELSQLLAADFLPFQLELVVSNARMNCFHEESEGLVRGAEYGGLDLRVANEGNHVVFVI